MRLLVETELKPAGGLIGAGLDELPLAPGPCTPVTSCVSSAR